MSKRPPLGGDAGREGDILEPREGCPHGTPALVSAFPMSAKQLELIRPRGSASPVSLAAALGMKGPI